MRWHATRGPEFNLVKEVCDHGRTLSEFTTLWRGIDEGKADSDVRLPNQRGKLRDQLTARRTRRANTER